MCVYCAAVHIISGKSIYVIHGLTRIAPTSHSPPYYTKPNDRLPVNYAIVYINLTTNCICIKMQRTHSCNNNRISRQKGSETWAVVERGVCN